MAGAAARTGPTGTSFPGSGGRRGGGAGRRPGTGHGRSFLGQARAALRSEGVRITRQREAVLDVIGRADTHVAADEIYQQARARDPGLSLSTIYRTLALLKRHGLVDELHLAEEHHHYEVRPPTQHYHLVCTECGAVEEVEEVFGGSVDHLRDALLRERGFAVASLELDIAGVCGRCRAAGGEEVRDTV